MQIIHNGLTRWDNVHKVTIVNVIDSFGRTNREVDALTMAQAIVEALEEENEDAYIVDVDIKSIPVGRRQVSDVYEIRVFDYTDLDDEIALCRIGADAKNNIHINNAPQINPLPSLVVSAGREIKKLKKGAK